MLVRQDLIWRTEICILSGALADVELYFLSKAWVFI